MTQGVKMNNYWEEELDKEGALRFGVNLNEIVLYKKCVNRGYGSIWYEVHLIDNRVLTASMPGH
jgi:hypothetical protein